MTSVLRFEFYQPNSPTFSVWPNGQSNGGFSYVYCWSYHGFDPQWKEQQIELQNGINIDIEPIGSLRPLVVFCLIDFVYSQWLIWAYYPHCTGNNENNLNFLTKLSLVKPLNAKAKYVLNGLINFPQLVSLLWDLVLVVGHFEQNLTTILL